jgi:hypothetical protein
MESSKSDDNSGKLTPAWSADIAVGEENASEHASSGQDVSVQGKSHAQERVTQPQVSMGYNTWSGYVLNTGEWRYTPIPISLNGLASSAA